MAKIIFTVGFISTFLAEGHIKTVHSSIGVFNVLSVLGREFVGQLCKLLFKDEKVLACVLISGTRLRYPQRVKSATLNANNFLIWCVFGSGLYNLVISIFEWIRRGSEYSEWDWAYLPQLLFLIFLFVLASKRYLVSNPLNLVALIFFGWFSTYLISAWDWYFYEERSYPYWWGPLQSISFPIFDIQMSSQAPLLGLFHSTDGNLFGNEGWYFDGGIAFSWLCFNLLSIFLILRLLSQYFLQDKKENLLNGSPNSKNSLFCRNCGVSVGSESMFCFRCGKQTYVAPVSNSQEIESHSSSTLESNSISTSNKEISSLSLKNLSQNNKLTILAIIGSFVLGIGITIGLLKPGKVDWGSDSAPIQNESSTRGYSVEMRNLSEGNFGNYCQTAPGYGWLCFAEVIVTNTSSSVISPRLSAELIDSQGRASLPMDDSSTNLWSTFNLSLNPGAYGIWGLQFPVGAGIEFTRLDIYDGITRVASLDVDLSSK